MKMRDLRSRWPLSRQTTAVVSMVTLLVLVTAGIALAAGYSLLTAGAVQFIDPAIYRAYDPATATGSGMFHPFVRISTNHNWEQGFNTDAGPRLDDNASTTFLHAEKLSAVPQRPDETFAGIYREFQLDINQQGSTSGAQLSLDEVQVWLTHCPNMVEPASWPTYPNVPATGQLIFTNVSLAASACPSSAELVYQLDAGTNNWLELNANLSAGSGKRDMLVRIPDSLFGNDSNCVYQGPEPAGANCNTYVILYSRFGNDNNAAMPNNDGYEEWGEQIYPITKLPTTIVTLPSPTTVTSLPATLQDMATLTGSAASVSGQITFALFGPSDASCTGTPLCTEVVPVNHGYGNYSTTVGCTLPAGAPQGTYNWMASYSGDALNDPSADACAAEPVLVDTGAPYCALTGMGINSQGQKYLQVTVQDTASGLAAGGVQVTLLVNGVVSIPGYPVGYTLPLVVTATKIDQTQATQFGLRVTDVAGNVTTCDPVDLTVSRETGKPVEHTFTAVPQAESKIYIRNEAPGIKNLRFIVNGQQFQVAGLKDGEVRELDVAAAMLPGDNNTITVIGLGKPVDSAYVMIHD